MRCLAVLVAAAFAFAGPAAAQSDFPARTVTMLVGFAPGGAADTTARIIARKLSENLGQTVVVENKAGAGGNIAHQAVAAAPADGYTILLGSMGPVCVAPHLVAKLSYDPFKDLAPLALAVSVPNVLVVPVSSPARSLAEYVALAKARPGSLDFASTGIASASHLAGELLNQRAGISVLHVPYKGGAPAMTDLLGGNVGAYYSTHSTAGPHIESGKLRPLAVTSLGRTPFLPNVPAISETYPGFVADNWYAFVTTSKVPEAIQERWNKELVKVLGSPEVKEQLAKHYIAPMPSTREEHAATMRQEYEMWGRVIRTAGIKAE